MTFKPPAERRVSKAVSRLFSGLLIFLSMAAGKTIAQTIDLDFNFRRGPLGWTSDFSSYPPYTNENGIYQLASGPRYTPRKLTHVPIRSYYVQGNNRSGALVMFMKRRMTTSDGIVAGQSYRLEYDLTLAGDAPKHCVGIGAPPGEGVYLRVGGSTIEPIPVLQPNRFLELNIDLWTATSAAGDIVNGFECEWAYPVFPFNSFQRSAQHQSVTAGPNGELWLFVGTKSLFEGLTRLYYQDIRVRLIPV